jgi:hypothetical protein
MTSVASTAFSLGESSIPDFFASSRRFAWLAFNPALGAFGAFDCADEETFALVLVTALFAWFWLGELESRSSFRVAAIAGVHADGEVIDDLTRSTRACREVILMMNFYDNCNFIEN